MPTPSFPKVWLRHGQRNGLSHELKPLAHKLYRALIAEPLDVAELRTTLERLLAFLASPKGRTNANCSAIDSFLSLGEFDWSDLPDAFQDILGDMAGALHDTVSAPEIAANFDSTPERLLARLRSEP
jgi:hypothetical protein